MDYQFDLQRILNSEVLIDSAGARAIEFTLGYVPDEDVIIVMSVMLIPTERSDVFELCFGIRAKEIKNRITVSEPDYSKKATDLFIPKASRTLVHNLIIEATTVLVQSVHCDYITMETFYSHLPAKAMTKYEAICGAVVLGGYELLDQFRNDDGIDYWSFGKHI